MRRFWLIYIFHLCITVSAFGQIAKPDSLFIKIDDLRKELFYKDFDSTYIASYIDQFNLRLLAINKINFFQGIDLDNDASVWYRPDRQLNLGIGFTYKWFSLDLAFNVGIEEKSAVENSSFFDFQGTVFSSKQFISSSLQYYYGYQLAGFSGFDSDFDTSIPREDVRTTLLILQYLFAFNYNRFSLKAPFILNEVQKKSAGSFLLGASFKLYNLSADSTLAPLENSTLNPLPITDINSLRFGINFGYMHTFVFLKHFFITASLIPEIGFTIGDYKTDYRQHFSNHISFGLSTMNAIGYNGERFYTGAHLIAEAFFLTIDKQYTMAVGNGKLKAFVGYRFGSKKK